MFRLCGVELENDCVNSEFEGIGWEAVTGYFNTLSQHLAGGRKARSSTFTAGIASL
jgi:hypothetical protein